MSLFRQLGLLALGGLVAAPAVALQHESAAAWMAQQQAALVRSDRILREAKKRPQLLDRYEYMRAQLSPHDNRAFHVIFNQYLSWYQSYLGDYRQAAASYSIAEPARSDDAPAPTPAHGYHAEPAMQAIARLARGRRAVFFNEAHNVVVTRSLTVPMLATLRAEGYNTFAAETLYASDTGLAARGYATAASGFYTEEPVYAEMVRTALKLGYRVIAYEADDSASGDARERQQARNLYRRAFAGHPHARLVVNAGYAHIVEKGKFLGGHSMAEHFRRLSGIDPLTVEQTMLYAHPDRGDDHPYYRAIIGRLHPKQPLVFVDAAGKPWALRPGYDVSVVFPAYASIDGRPAWLTLGGLRRPYPIPVSVCRQTYPCLIQAHYVNEGGDAVAADRLLLQESPNASVGASAGGVGRFSRNTRVYLPPGMFTPQVALFLRPGRYRLSATGLGGRQLSGRTIRVAATLH